MDKTDIKEQIKYKTIRIYPRDFSHLRTEAYHQRTTIVNCLSQIISEHKKRLLEEKMEAIELLFFTNNNHKEIFIKYLEQFPFEAENKDNLLIFYVSAAIGIYDEQIPIGGANFWRQTINNSSSDESFVLDDGYKQIVDFAFVLLFKSNDKDIKEELIKVNNDLLLVVKEMIRLSLYNLDEISMMNKL